MSDQTFLTTVPYIIVKAFVLGIPKVGPVLNPNLSQHSGQIEIAILHMGILQIVHVVMILVVPLDCTYSSVSFR